MMATDLAFRTVLRAATCLYALVAGGAVLAQTSPEPSQPAQSVSPSGPAPAAPAVDGAIAPPAADSSATPVADANAAAGDVPGGEIVVSARRRGETLISVPVTASVVTGETLVTKGITNLEGFARTIPNLFIANSSGSFQGAALGLRGISAGDGVAFGDQAVAFNIDGVQIARSTPQRLSSFDLQQVDVLKGPQALYFGKNSPGGIVVIHTADPGDHLEAGIRGTYEFNAHERRVEAFVSGPLTDSVGARVAVSYAKIRGWVHNITTPGTLYSPSDPYSPESSDFGGRVTLKFNNGGPLKARFKFNYGNVSGDGIFSNSQRVVCPLGAPQLGGPDDCTPDNHVVRANLGPRFGSGGVNTITGATIVGVPLYGDGTPIGKTKQYLSGLELSYDLGSGLSLASNSGYYKSRSVSLDNLNGADATSAFNPLSPAAPGGLFATYADLSTRELSEELRLTSNFSGWFNFMAGGYYQNQHLSYVAAAGYNALNPIQLFPPVLLRQKTDAYSFFGSVSAKPIDTIEISGGARYSHEGKDLSIFRVYPGTLPSGATFTAGQEVPLAEPERNFHNVSPEVTLTWRPNTDVTLYGGWKRGFLSGGFNSTGTGTAVAVIPPRSYEQEIVQGFEGGIKAQAFDRTLQVTAAVFSYDIKGLQVAVTLPGPPPVNTINNAATARSRGAEADFNWRSPVAGLSFNGAIAYNDATYKSFLNSPCYAGQTIALGCNVNLVAGVYRNQDLSGARLLRAPKWAGNIGANYTQDIGSDSNLTLSASGSRTSSYFTDALNTPEGIQHGYWLLDASARLKTHGFELGLVGRNLTNKYYFQRSTGVLLAGGPSGVASSFPTDQVAYVSRGREIAVQVGFRF